ncbi:MAG: molybdopterin-dependent oxidoreductase [Kiloniellales bacterium]
MPGTKEHIRTTCPRDCYDACGIVVMKRGGAITKVLGDPEHSVARGALCGKCALAYNGVYLDPAARLTTPLRRTGPKGEGRFEPIGWDEAIDIVAGKLKAVVDEAGAQAILHTHYTGTCSLIAGNFPERFFNRLGATEVDPDSICNLAGHVALNYILGASTVGFDPRAAKDAACIVVWGANPHASAPHAHKYWLKEAPGKVIVIDPLRHPTAEQADLHLQPFPGSDAALAFALLHVIRRDGLLDEAYLTAHTTGWDEIEAEVGRCDPAWGEAATGVPAALIEEAARTYAPGPSLLWLGQGMQRQPLGGNAFRAAALLPAATGNMAKAGAGFYFLNGYSQRGFESDYLSAPQLARGAVPSISHMDLAERLEDAAASRALVSWNMNVAASGPQQRRLHRALGRDDLFSVVIELFPTDTTDFADIVLPAASFLEFDDVVMSYFNYTVSAQAKAAEPMGEALPNQEIFRRLAQAMGFNEPELFESDEAMIETMMTRLGVEGGFEALREKGTVRAFTDPFVPFADGVYPTPSGKIEIASDRAAADGHPRAPIPHADARPADGRLRLLSPASPWLMNDSYANDPKVEEQLGAATVALHPEDAAERGLSAGDRATLANDTGSLELAVAISDVVPRGIALSHKGRWPKREGQGANVNVLNPGIKTDMGASTSVHGVEVVVSRA